MDLKKIKIPEIKEYSPSTQFECSNLFFCIYHVSKHNDMLVRITLKDLDYFTYICSGADMGDNQTRYSYLKTKLIKQLKPSNQVEYANICGVPRLQGNQSCSYLLHAITKWLPPTVTGHILFAALVVIAKCMVMHESFFTRSDHYY